MKNQALITVKGKQKGENGDTVIEYSVGGEYECKNGSLRVWYDEPEDGNGKTRTEIRATGDMMALCRRGALNMTMFLRKNERHICNYSNSIGDMMIAVRTKNFKSNFGENGGTVNARYDLEINSNLVSENTIRISVKSLRSQ